MGAGNRVTSTVHDDDIWMVVHRSGVGLLAGKSGETTASSLGKTLLRLAVAGQQKGRKGGPKLTARQARNENACNIRAGSRRVAMRVNF